MLFGLYESWKGKIKCMVGNEKESVQYLVDTWKSQIMIRYKALKDTMAHSQTVGEKNILSIQFWLKSCTQ